MDAAEIDREMTAYRAWMRDFLREYHGRALIYGQEAAEAWRDEILARNGENPEAADLSHDTDRG
jgi:hypothetical protein